MKRLFKTGIPIIIATAILAVLLSTRRGGPDLDAELAAWQSIGGRTDVRDLAPDPVPDDLNAAVLYRQAFRSLDRLTNVRPSSVYFQHPPPDRAQLEALVAGLEDAVEAACAAADRPYCVWDVWDIDLASSAFTAEVFYLQARALDLGAVLAAHAQLQAEYGNLRAAAESLRAMRALVAHLALIPAAGVVSAMLLVEMMMFEQLERLFRDRELPETCAEWFRPSDYRGLMRRTLLAEGALVLTFFDDPCFSGHAVDDPHKQQDKALYLRAMRRIIQNVDEGGGTGEMDDGRKSLPKWAMAASRGVPSMDYPLEYLAVVENRTFLANAALDLRAYRLEHGKYPPALPPSINSGSGDLLGYRREGNGFELHREPAQYPSRGFNEAASRWRWN